LRHALSSQIQKNQHKIATERSKQQQHDNDNKDLW
jgi:hypothetical protein